MSVTIDGTLGINSVQPGSVKGGTGAVAVGQVGELIAATGTNASLSNGVPGNTASITLTPGVWDVSAYAFFSATVGPCVHRYVCASTTSASDTGAVAFGNNSNSMTIGYTDVVVSPVKRLVVSSNTTLYCVVRAAFSGGTCTCDSGTIEARRVA